VAAVNARRRLLIAAPAAFAAGAALVFAGPAAAYGDLPGVCVLGEREHRWAGAMGVQCARRSRGRCAGSDLVVDARQRNLEHRARRLARSAAEEKGAFARPRSRPEGHRELAAGAEGDAAGAARGEYRRAGDGQRDGTTRVARRGPAAPSPCSRATTRCTATASSCTSPGACADHNHTFTGLDREGVDLAKRGPGQLHLTRTL